MFNVLKVIFAVLPIFFAGYGARIYAQETMDRRMMSVEIDLARQDERFRAIVARLDAYDKTLWWLIMATFTSSGISGAVAADRVVYKRKHRTESS